MNHEHFFSDGGLTPHCFFHIHFFEKKVLPFFASFVNPLVFTRWRTFGCYSATWMNNNKNLIKQQHWTMNIFVSDGGLTPHFFFIFIFLRRRSYPSSFHLSILWSSPGGKDLLVFTGGGRACPKITARCWEIVSVGQLVVRQFQWEMLGLTLTIFDWTIYDF